MVVVVGGLIWGCSVRSEEHWFVNGSLVLRVDWGMREGYGEGGLEVNGWGM